MEAQVQYQVEGGKAVLTIDRPKARNALSLQVLAELSEALDRADGDPAVRVVVLTGAGENAFCAGADLSGALGGGFLEGHEGRRAYGLLLRQLQEGHKPTIARVNGHALAGGLGLLLACDLAVAAEHAELGTPEIHHGLFPWMVVTLLQRHLGRKRALELVLLGERIRAAEAVAWGLLNRAVPKDRLDAEVDALAGKLAAKSQAVVGLGRRAFFNVEDLPFAQGVEVLAAQLSLNLLLEDAGEGVTAFLQKRPARWNDR